MPIASGRLRSSSIASSKPMRISAPTRARPRRASPSLLDGVQSCDAGLEVDEPLHRHGAVGEQLIGVVERACGSGSARRGGSAAPRGSRPLRGPRVRWRSYRVAWPSSRRHAQMLAVAPDADEAFAGRCFRLRDLVLVVRKDVVDAAAVDVEALAEQCHAHRRALDVPAGMAPADARVPADLIGPDRLPECEVAHVLLGVVVRVDAAARAGDKPLGARAAQLAVRGKRGDVEVVAAVGLIRRAGLLETLDEVDHLSMYSVARG